jgi:hypothetical protein
MLEGSILREENKILAYIIRNIYNIS